MPPTSSLATPGGVGPAIRASVMADRCRCPDRRSRLYAAGEAPGEADLVTTATTDAAGSVDLRLRNAIDDEAMLHATARGGTVRGLAMPDTVELAVSLGDLRKGGVVIDELSTVAAGRRSRSSPSTARSAVRRPGCTTPRSCRATWSSSPRAMPLIGLPQQP